MQGPQAEKKGIFKTDSLQNPPRPHTCLWGSCVAPGGHCSVGHPHFAWQTQSSLNLGYWAWLIKRPPSVVKRRHAGFVLVSSCPNPEQSLSQGGSQSCTRGVRGVEGHLSWMTIVLSGCGAWGGDSQRLGLRQGGTELDVGEHLSAY